MTEVVAGKTVASAERIKICEDWVRTCTAVNMPCFKSDHPSIRQFLKEKVINGSAIPGYHQLQENLGDVYLKVKEELKQHLAGKPVTVIFDETPDVEVCGQSAPQSVENLHEMLQVKEQVQPLQIQLNIMTDKCKVILQLLDIF
ncbi:uncharacterized protein LOC110512346 isoform X2 [Oncorhynchus mykiss]|uniref:uncharacterized protein LOC110512346 isoform X2 n=1 Tax=Oncorhynchus mykiss TaxID=8022 RepID=UPI001877C01F|nr:uncharacterized protein LOC110512346 isoform X2 [Oncorhynchus mykiss]